MIGIHAVENWNAGNPIWILWIRIIFGMRFGYYLTYLRVLIMWYLSLSVLLN